MFAGVVHWHQTEDDGFESRKTLKLFRIDFGPQLIQLRDRMCIPVANLIKLFGVELLLDWSNFRVE